MLDGWFLVLGIQALSLFPPAVVVATRAALLLGILRVLKLAAVSSFLAAAFLEDCQKQLQNASPLQALFQNGTSSNS